MRLVWAGMVSLMLHFLWSHNPSAQAPGHGEGAVLLEVDGIDLLAVALLVQHLGQLLQVLQPPGVVPDGGGEEPAAGVVAAPRHPRVVTLDVRQRLLAVQTPQLDRAVPGAARQTRLAVVEADLGGGAPGDGAHVGGVAAQRPGQAAVLHLPDQLAVASMELSGLNWQ